MTDEKEAHREINRRRRDWITAVEAGDARAYAALVTPNVVWEPPHGLPLIVGRRAFLRWVAPFMARYSYEFTLGDPDIRLNRTAAVEHATFSSRLTPRAGGAPMEHYGRYVASWSRGHDGIWRIERYTDLL